MLKKVIKSWKLDLVVILNYIENKKFIVKNFKLKLFLFFLFINIFFYWFAMLTAFPELVFGETFSYYFKVQFPVGVLGSIFDSSSFFLTIYIIKRAIKTNKNLIYIAHLSIDIFIAILATFWVLFVFVISGWIINQIDSLTLNGMRDNSVIHTYELDERTTGYNNLVKSAIKSPLKNLSNIYFGIVMGLSAMIPTLIHLVMFILAFTRVTFKHKLF